MGDIPTVHNHHQDQAEPTNPPPTVPDDLMMDPVQQTNQEEDGPASATLQAEPTNPPPTVPDDLVNPLGWNFKPRHESNVNILRKKIAGYPVNLDKTIVVEGDFYSQPPEQLLANKPYSYKNKYLVMVDRKFKDKGKVRFNRQLPASTPGSWEPKGNVTSVLDSATGHRIGTRSAYRFYSGTHRAGNKAPSSWKMVEYLSTGPIASNLALCCVYKSETKDEKLARKKQKNLDKSVYKAKVKEDTTKLRAEKAARAAEKAEATYLCEKLRVKFRRFRAAAGGAAGSVNDEDDLDDVNDVNDASVNDVNDVNDASVNDEDDLDDVNDVNDGADEDEEDFEECPGYPGTNDGWNEASASASASASAAGDAAQEMVASDGLRPDNGADEDEDDLGGVGQVRYGDFGSISIQLR